jgi:hypothetical protein
MAKMTDTEAHVDAGFAVPGAGPGTAWKRCALLWLPLLAASCQSSDAATETMVLIDADAVVRAACVKLHTLVESDKDKTVSSESEIMPHWPIRLALVPMAGDAGREFRVTVEARDTNDALLVSARVISGFVANRKRYLSLWLSQSCLHHTPECDRDATCRAGECVPARAAPTERATPPCKQGEQGQQAEQGQQGEQADASIPDACHAAGKLPTMMLQCSPGYADCNSNPDDGCETDLSDSAHCGACDAACTAPTQLCAAMGSGYACVDTCQADGGMRCGDSCVDTNRSLEHCGTCENRCADVEHGHAVCANGACGLTCDRGYSVCTGACFNLSSDNAHCGDCEVSCSGSRICSAGQCQCPEGTHDCNGKCAPNEVATSCGDSCEPCAVPAHGSAVCVAGRCDITCQNGYSACAGRCVASFTDNDNCGSCGNACGANHVCQGGTCVACTAGAACTFTECRNGQSQCDGGMRCVAAGAVSDGTACGDGASCQAGQCTCGQSSGSTARWYGCTSDRDCTPGDVCVDSGGNGKLFCKPLCDFDTDCQPLTDGTNLKCVAVSCSNGRSPKIRVCDEPNSVLAPSYGASACCGGVGPGTPSSAGCADGTREAFADVSMYPDIAGCAATWPLSSMRAAKTGHPCGNGLGACTVSADACGTGWHVCAAPPYGPADISGKVTADECNAQQGTFAAAIADQRCDVCSDEGGSAACCGSGCMSSGGSCLFAGATKWFPDSSDGHINKCNAVIAPATGAGVLCCRGY